VEFKRDIIDDLLNSEVVDQFHSDLLVERLADSDNTEPLRKRTERDEVPKIASKETFFYRLVSHEIELISPTNQSRIRVMRRSVQS
jgi:hypothetical protein